MKNVLVTGATGFIGSHLSELLIEKGYNVVAFDRYNINNDWGWLENSKCSRDIKVILGDIRDYDSISKAMVGCDAVIHLAALIGIPYSYISPLAYIRTNVEGTYNILEASKNQSVDQVLITSTSETYGSAQYVPIDEKHPLVGQSPYSASKIAADQLAISYYRSFDLPVKIVRPFNTYGPRQSARAIIPTIISQIFSGKRQIKLGSVSPTRDFNYVKDTAAGFIAALNSDKGLGEIVNFGSNFEVSIGDTAQLISKVMGAEIDIVTDEARLRPENSEVERLWADNRKAKELFGWKPYYADREGFELGLKETIEWFKDPANIQMYKAGIYNQ